MSTEALHGLYNALFALQNFLELEFLTLSKLAPLNHTAVVFQSSFQAYYVPVKVTQDFFLGNTCHEAANYVSTAHIL